LIIKEFILIGVVIRADLGTVNLCSCDAKTCKSVPIRHALVIVAFLPIALGAGFSSDTRQAQR
jgi:hypothetical protein